MNLLLQLIFNLPVDSFGSMNKGTSEKFVRELRSLLLEQSDEVLLEAVVRAFSHLSLSESNALFQKEMNQIANVVGKSLIASLSEETSLEQQIR